MSAWTIRPVRNRVVVKPDPDPQQLGAIVLPTTAINTDRETGKQFVNDWKYVERFRTGTVIAVGSGRLTKRGRINPIEVQPGDRVAFDRFAGNDVTLEDELFVILLAEDLLAQIAKEPR